MTISTDHELMGRHFNAGCDLPKMDMFDSLSANYPSSSIRGYYNFNRFVLTGIAFFEGGGKRKFDILMSLLILVVTSPIMLVTMLIIWCSSLGKDPIFYRQVRVGLNGKLFSVLKFRSMRTDAEKAGAQMAARNDTRVTCIGRFIRKTRIDELPQLFNVLKGEMSLVGPRPERPEFVTKFEKKIAGYSRRHQVKPGITGWAQVQYPYGETVEDAANKLFYDLSYINRYSLLLDIAILFQTIPVVLTGHGAR